MKRMLVAFALAGVVGTPATVPAQSASPTTKAEDGNVFKDAWLTSKTKTKLLADKRVKSLEISVDTTGAVVTLRGKVATFDERTAAEEIARGVDGVKSVSNTLQVVPNAFRKRIDERDDEIEVAVKERLAKDDRLADSDISVRTDAGLVTLRGSVADSRARARAADTARAVPGVKAVKNELRAKSL
jgi:hyperosmotically inducible protein